MKADSNSPSHTLIAIFLLPVIFSEMVLKIRLFFIDRLEKNALHVEKK